MHLTNFRPQSHTTHTHTRTYMLTRVHIETRKGRGRWDRHRAREGDIHKQTDMIKRKINVPHFDEILLAVINHFQQRDKYKVITSFNYSWINIESPPPPPKKNNIYIIQDLNGRAQQHHSTGFGRSFVVQHRSQSYNTYPWKSKILTGLDSQQFPNLTSASVVSHDRSETAVKRHSPIIFTTTKKRLISAHLSVRFYSRWLT